MEYAEFSALYQTFGNWRMNRRQSGDILDRLVVTHCAINVRTRNGGVRVIDLVFNYDEFNYKCTTTWEAEATVDELESRLENLYSFLKENYILRVRVLVDDVSSTVVSFLHEDEKNIIDSSVNRIIVI